METGGKFIYYTNDITPILQIIIVALLVISVWGIVIYGITKIITSVKSGIDNPHRSGFNGGAPNDKHKK